MRSSRCVLLVSSALLMSFACAVPALAQTATVHGRVEDAATRSPVVGALVFLSGRGSVLTDRSGQFQLSGVPLAVHELRVQALGYKTSLQRFEVRADTTVAVALDPSPVQVDSLRVTARRVTVRGTLIDEVSKQPVVDAAVFGSQMRQTRSNAVGRFQLKDVPLGVPFEILVVAFPYQTVQLTIVPERDTTIAFGLLIDTMVERLVDEQHARLDVRLKETVGEGYSVSRADLAKYQDIELGHALNEILRAAPFSRSRATVCVFVDEQEVAGDSMLMPTEVERVDYLYGGAMMRIYTKRFIAQLISSDTKLHKTGFSQPPRGFLGRYGQPSCG